MKNLLLALACSAAINVFGQNVGIGNSNPSSKLDVNGDLSLRDGGTITVSSNTIALPTAKNSIYRISSSSGYSIKTITGGNDGMILMLINTGAGIMTINNGTGNINTNVGSDLVGSSATTVVTLLYNANLAKWVVTSSQGFNAPSATTSNSLGLSSSTLTSTVNGTAANQSLSSLPVGGDLSGTIGNATVAKINGATLGTTTATSGNILVANGSNQWTSVGMSGDATIDNTGKLTVTGSGTGNGYIKNQTGQQTPANFNIAGNGTIGGTLNLTPMTAGSVLFAGTSGVVSQNNANIFWDNINKRLGIVNPSPAYSLDFGATDAIKVPTGTTLQRPSSPTAGATRFNSDNASLEYYDGTQWVPANTAQVPIGTITPYGASTAPSGWLVCDGSAVSRTTYASLFAIIGTTYGAGNGSTTFNLPDLRGKAAFGLGSSAPYNSLGATGGAIQYTPSIGLGSLSVGIPSLSATMPDHNHNLPGHYHSFSLSTVANSSGYESNHTHLVPAQSFNTTDGAGAHQHLSGLRSDDGGYVAGSNNPNAFHYNMTSGGGGTSTTDRAQDKSAYTNLIQSAGSHNHTINVPAITSNSGSSHNHSIPSLSISGSIGTAGVNGDATHTSGSATSFPTINTTATNATLSGSLSASAMNTNDPFQVVNYIIRATNSITSPAAAISVNITGGLLGQTFYYNGTTWTPTSNLYNNGTSIGIGTTGPNTTLDVNGSATIRGLTTAGIVTTTSGGLLSSVATVPNSNLTNNGALTVTAGTGLSGGGSVALGGSITLNSTGVTAVSAGTGIGTSASTGGITISNTGVTSVASGSGISLSGSTGGVTINNTGVTAVSAGTGIGTSASTGGITISNTGVTSISAGTGISASQSTGGVTLSVNGSVLTTSNVSGSSGYHAKFTGANSLGNSIVSDNGSNVTIGGTVSMSDKDIYFRGTSGSDINHGLGWYSSGTKTFSSTGFGVDGPVLYGCSGGGLGTVCTPNIALSWIGNGNVAIGGTASSTQLGRLTVNGIAGQGNTNVGSFTYHANFGSCSVGVSSCSAMLIGGSSSGSVDVSIYATNRIACTELDAFSDRRIKKDFILSKNDEDLKAIQQIEVTDFRYVDDESHGTDYKKGFIAQQVETVFPQAVNKNTNYVPTIYQMSSNVVFDEETQALTVTLNKPSGLKVGDFVKTITPKSDENRKKVKQIIDEKTFVLEYWDEPKDTSIFVYGPEVNDFRTVDYDRIFTLNVSATQELIKKVTVLEQENETLKNAYNRLDEQNCKLTERLQNNTASNGDIQLLRKEFEQLKAMFQHTNTAPTDTELVTKR